MVRVPNSNIFGLQDVVDVISPSVDDLSTCFKESTAAYFDATYKGVKDRLSNFRNYGTGDVLKFEAIPDFYYDKSGYIDKMGGEGGVWSTTRNATAGTGVKMVEDFASGENYEAYVEYDSGADTYNNYRTFWRFDLTDIPADASIISAGIGINIYSTYGASYYEVVGIDSSGWLYLTTANYNDFSFSSAPFSTYDTTPESHFDLWDVALVAASAANKLKVASYFNDYLYVVIINDYYDYNIAASPTDKRGIAICKTSEKPGPCLIIEYTEAP